MYGTSDHLQAALHILVQLFSGVHEQLRIAEETAENRGQLDLSVLAAQYDGDLADWRTKFKIRSGPTHLQISSSPLDRIIAFTKARLDCQAHYTSLCIHSNVLKHALEFRPLDSGAFFRACYTSATSLLRIAKQDYSETGGWLLSAPDSMFVAISFAAVSLLRFCQPPLGTLHNHRTAIFLLLESMVSRLQETSTDLTHPARQNAAFLRKAIDTFPTSPPPSSRDTPNAPSPTALWPHATALIPQPEEDLQADDLANKDDLLSDLDFPFFARDWTYSDSFWDGVLGDNVFAQGL